MAENDSHPADSLHDAFMGLFNGDNVKQALRGAWDRVFGSSSTPSAHDQAISQMNKQANDQRVQPANQSFIDAAKADKIRKQAMK